MPRALSDEIAGDKIAAADILKNLTRMMEELRE